MNARYLLLGSILWVGLVVTVPAVAEPAKAEPRTFTAEGLSRSTEWRLLREPRFERGYPWALKEGYLVNTAPEGTPYEAIKGLDKGMGLSIYGRAEPLPAGYEVSGAFRVDPASAAGFVLNAALKDDALASHYLLLLYHGGVILWKYTFTGAGADKGQYLKLGWVARPLKPDTDYELKIAATPRAGGCELSISLDRQHVLGVTDTAPFPPGTLGIWLGEGYARVKRVAITPGVP